MLTDADRQAFVDALAFSDWQVDVEWYTNEDDLLLARAGWWTADRREPVGAVVVRFEEDAHNAHFVSLYLREENRYQRLYTHLWTPGSLHGWLTSRGYETVSLDTVDSELQGWWRDRGFAEHEGGPRMVRPLHPPPQSASTGRPPVQPTPTPDPPPEQLQPDEPPPTEEG